MMDNSYNEIDMFGSLKKFLKSCYYFSPSYFYYMTIELNKEKYANIEEKAKEEFLEAKRLKDNISEVMKNFFYFIDLIIIFVILVKNTIGKLKTNVLYDGILYIIITGIVLFFAIHFLTMTRGCVRKEGLIEKILDFNEYKKNCGKSCAINNIKRKIVEISLGKTIYIIGICISIIGWLAPINKISKMITATVVIYYFIMRTVHYCVVFYEDFEKKVSRKFVDSPEGKMRYIKLALLNYVKIFLEFSILIYILKYMGWAFEKITSNTLYELVNFILSGKLEATTTIEIFINFLRLGSLAMVITLNLATYMSLEVKCDE